MMSIEQITQQALSLPLNLRQQLVDELLASFEVDVDERIQTVWLNNAKRRLDEVRQGVIQVIPGEEALARVRKIIS